MIEDKINLLIVFMAWNQMYRTGKNYGNVIDNGSKII